MPTKMRQRLVSAVQLILAVSLAVGMYVYGTARNRGAVPYWFDDAFSLIWLVLVIAAIFLIARHSENRYVGSLLEQKPTLTATERLVFKNSFMSAQFFPDGMPFKTNPTLWEWLKGGPIRVVGLLAVELTTKKLIFGLAIGRTWRAVELDQITDIEVLNEKWPYRDAVLIKYKVESGAEKILMWTGSGAGRRFKDALQAATGAS
jgi:hypothetical protein